MTVVLVFIVVSVVVDFFEGEEAPLAALDVLLLDLLLKVSVGDEVSALSVSLLPALALVLLAFEALAVLLLDLLLKVSVGDEVSGEPAPKTDF